MTALACSAIEDPATCRLEPLPANTSGPFCVITAADTTDIPISFGQDCLHDPLRGYLALNAAMNARAAMIPPSLTLTPTTLALTHTMRVWIPVYNVSPPLQPFMTYFLGVLGISFHNDLPPALGLPCLLLFLIDVSHSCLALLPLPSPFLLPGPISFLDRSGFETNTVRTRLVETHRQLFPGPAATAQLPYLIAQYDVQQASGSLLDPDVAIDEEGPWTMNVDLRLERYGESFQLQYGNILDFAVVYRHVGGLIFVLLLVIAWFII